MNKTIKFGLAALTILSTMTMQAKNVLLTPYEGTIHETVPFSQITDDMWMPAIDYSISVAKQEVDAITKNRAMPDFDNTIVALERVGNDLNRVLGTFYPLLSANSNDRILEVGTEASRKISEYSTSITLNEELWKRVKTVYDNRAKFNLDAEDSMLLQKTYESFALNGANLQGADREKYRELSAELSALSNTFSQNVLKEMSTYEIYLTKDDLDGLTAGVVAAAAEAAEAKGRKGEYLFTLAQPTYTAFMQYSTRRDLREKMYKLYNSRNTTGEFSNIEIVKQIVELRRQIANLLGSKTHAQQSLKRTMAENPEAVYNLLNQLAEAYRPALDAEMKELSKFASKLEGKKFEIKPWDYSFYSNKLKAKKYSFDEEALRPYFELNKTIEGVFGLATKLYGITFTKNTEIEVYHPDVNAYEVNNADGSYLGVLYTDFFPRASKRPGAWMTNFKEQCITPDGENSRPHVTIVMNFTKPTADTPALLTPYEVETFLHEFGHALHGLLANSKYSSLSGTSVYRDFVELPSQFNENYMMEKEFLDSFASHYQTGEKIPTKFVNRLIKSAQCGAAYSCMRQLNFGFLDMAWHTVEAPVSDVAGFEYKAIEPVQIFAPVEGCLLSPQFSHIFSGGYAAGYYSYKWAEVLDADAFAFFKEKGIFSKEASDSFRKNILEMGGTEHPAELYRRFRGQDPSIDALLKRDGIR